MNSIMPVAQHPSSVCFSPDGHDEDDHSELTGPSGTGDRGRDDDSLGSMAADPYYYHSLGGLLPSSPEEREVIELKIRLARQQEKIDSLSFKLGKCEDENEALRAERAGLVDELAVAKEERTTTRREGRPATDSKIKPIKQLVDLNAFLTRENARLQAIVDVTRKSFQAHIRDSRRRRDEDKRTIEALRLQQALHLQQENATERKDLRSSERTARTSLMSSFTDSIIWGPIKEVDFGAQSSDERAAAGEAIEMAAGASLREGVPRALGKTTDGASGQESGRVPAVVEVNGARRGPMLAWRGRRRSADAAAGSGGVEDLLVGFGGSAAPRGWVSKSFRW